MTHHRNALFVLCTVLALAAPSLANSVYMGYKLTENAYHNSADWTAAVKAEFGPTAEVADWQEIKAQFGGSHQVAWDFTDAVLGPYPLKHSGYLLNNGNKVHSGSRHWIITAGYGSKPHAGYAIFDQIQSKVVVLGSWYGNYRILAKNVPAENPIPEPMTALAVGGALAGLGGYLRRRRQG